MSKTYYRQQVLQYADSHQKLMAVRTGLTPSVEPKDYKYTIYARKSTQDKNKQVQSIADQIAVCQEYAQVHKLKVVEILKESQTAKLAGIEDEVKNTIEGIAGPNR